jgi:type IV pilus assembly protein PilW
VDTSKQCALGIRGLSLIELLVAIAVGVVLSFGAMNLFLHSKMSYLQDEEMARLQENGRYALRYLSHELAMAGYLGSLLPGEFITSSATGSDCFNHLMEPAAALEHVSDVTTSGVPAGAGAALPGDCLLAGKHVAGSDIVLGRRTMDAAVVYRGEQRGALDAATIYLRTSGWDELSSTESRLQRGAGSLGANVDLWEYVPQVLFLRNYSLAAGDGIPTLCRKRLARSSNRMAPTQCLIEGIENLQLEFGIDDDGDRLPDRYDDAPCSAELRSAVAARIHLLVRSIHPLSGYVDNRSYQLGSTTVAAPNDGYYRRLMQTTVLLRNAAGPGF